jgi:quercetin dioxygenase-like cupin family protein
MTHDPAGEDLWFLNSRLRVLSRPASGARAPSLVEHRMPHGDSPPLHVHRGEDEVFHILEGEVRFRVGDREIVAHTGDTLVGPKGVPHTFRVESAQARFLTLATAGDFEAMMREVARPAGEGLPPMSEPSPAEVEALVAAAARHGIDILGPPMHA